MRIRLSFGSIVVSLFFLRCFAFAAESEKLEVHFGGFIDTYYAYDFNQPAAIDRNFTTQPARHNEFNINLAFLEAKISSSVVRGRLALQAGTSVQANYASEPTVGNISGAMLSRHIQEAYVGYQAVDKLWIDAGIYLSHLGLESFISRDNWTYSRSLGADFSPYYQAGVRASYQWSEKVSTQFHLINGWQNISENNSNKAVGLQIAYAPVEAVALSYNNFLGAEVGNTLRFFNDFIAKIELSKEFQVAAVYDVGTQTQRWQAFALLTRYQVHPKVAVTARIERYSDPKQIIVNTGTPNGFVTNGASLNGDVTLAKNILWRTEVRGLWSKDLVYSYHGGKSKTDSFAVTSLALSF